MGIKWAQKNQPIGVKMVHKWIINNKISQDSPWFGLGKSHYSPP